MTTWGRKQAARETAWSPVVAVRASNLCNRSSAVNEAAESSPSSTTRTRPPPNTGMTMSVPVIASCRL